MCMCVYACVCVYVCVCVVLCVLTGSLLPHQWLAGLRTLQGVDGEPVDRPRLQVVHLSVAVVSGRQVHLSLGFPILTHRGHSDAVARHLSSGSSPGQSDLVIGHLEELQVCRGIHLL